MCTLPAAHLRNSRPVSNLSVFRQPSPMLQARQNRLRKAGPSARGTVFVKAGGATQGCCSLLEHLVEAQALTALDAMHQALLAPQSLHVAAIRFKNAGQKCLWAPPSGGTYLYHRQDPATRPCFCQAQQDGTPQPQRDHEKILHQRQRVTAGLAYLAGGCGVKPVATNASGWIVKCSFHGSGLSSPKSSRLGALVSLAASCTRVVERFESERGLRVRVGAATIRRYRSRCGRLSMADWPMRRRGTAPPCWRHGLHSLRLWRYVCWQLCLCWP